MSPRDVAMYELTLIAAALADLGGAGTADAVATRLGMPRTAVLRRLKSGGLSAPGKVPRYFKCQTPAGGRHRSGWAPGVWELTAAGRARAAVLAGEGQ